MVQVKWRKAALKDLNTLLEKAYLEYGQHTMNNHISILEDIQKRMQMYPDSYPPEPLLRGKRRRYRGAHLLGRFEVIYYYSLKSKCVYVVRLWDIDEVACQNKNCHSPTQNNLGFLTRRFMSSSRAALEKTMLSCLTVP